ncbi:hypothetical protein NMY22_g4096 [Coprinellus aureogranulatus]|nr:hypothetical protein NMY22_g4096 [Coprinellus aureogranulatus]
MAGYSDLLEQEIFTVPSFELECGTVLKQAPVAYKTWGKLNEEKDNVMIICHAFTGSADVEDWWGPLMGRNKAFDPNRWFIFCANVLGSPYGSASPVTINPDTGKPYGPEFPPTSIRDDVRIHKLVLDALGVKSVGVVIGGSMGGMAVLEWPLCSPPGYVRHIIPLATSARHSAWCISWGEAQRQSIYSDPQYEDGFYTSQPASGLAAARMSALLTYRSRDSFESRFGRKAQTSFKGNSVSSLTPPASPRTSSDNSLVLHNDGLRYPKSKLPEHTRSNSQDASAAPSPANPPQIFSAQGYLRYQGEKFIKRFDANCYIHITRKLDTHDIARGRVEDPLAPDALAKPLALAQVASGTRPFDTLIHYILGPPSASTSSSGSGSLSPPQSQSAGGASKHVPEKILLKQAILVTTLSAPYLAVPPEPPANLRLGSSSKRSSTIRSRTNSSYDAGSLGSMTKKNMASSKSMPEGMGHKRRDTMPPIPPLPPLSPSSEETTEGESLNPSKSTSSFKSLKKRFTLSRRSSYVPEVPALPSHTSDDGHSTTTTAGRSGTKKRFSLSLGSRSNRSSILTPNPDDVAAQLEAYSRLQTSTLIRRYAGRSHIVHVLCEPADYVVSPSSSPSSPSVSAALSGGNVKGKSRASSVVPIVPRRPGALVKGIEQFLVAFAYPVQGISASLSSSSSSRSATPPSPARSPVLGAPATLEGRRDETKPVPFVLRSGTLGAIFRLPGSGVTGSAPGVGESPQHEDLGGGGEEERKASVAECVMFGALDGGERHGAWKAWLDIGGEVLLGDGGVRVKMEGRGVDEMLGLTPLASSSPPPSSSLGSGSYPPIAGKGLPRANEETTHHARVTPVDMKTGISPSESRRNLSGHGGYGKPAVLRCFKPAFPLTVE